MHFKCQIKLFFSEEEGRGGEGEGRGGVASNLGPGKKQTLGGFNAPEGGKPRRPIGARGAAQPALRLAERGERDPSVRTRRSLGAAVTLRT